MSDGLTEASRYSRDLQACYQEGKEAASSGKARHENMYRGVLVWDFWQEWDRGWVYSAGVDRERASTPAEGQTWASVEEPEARVKISGVARLVERTTTKRLVLCIRDVEEETLAFPLHDFLYAYCPA